MGLLVVYAALLRDHRNQTFEREYVQLEITAHLSAAWLRSSAETAAGERCRTRPSEEACQAWLEDLAPPPPLLLTVFDAAGRVVARLPPAPDAWQTTVDHPVVRHFSLSDLRSLRFRSLSPIDGVERFYVIYRISQEDHFIVVGSPTLDATQRIARRGLLLGFVLLLLCGLGYLLLRRHRAVLSAEQRLRDQRKALEGANARLRESERRFKHLFAGAHGIAIQGYHPDGRVFFWNEGSEQLYGRAASDMIGTDGLALFPDDANRQEARAFVDRLLRGEQLPPLREYRLLRADGQPLYVLTHHVVFRPDDGPPELYTIALDMTHLKALEAQLRERATRDALTGLWNRGYFLQQAERQLRDARETRHGAALLMVDADHFKRVNDQHGHSAGDAVLVGLARRMEGSLRDTDLLGRLGGEEFAVVLPRVTLAMALQGAERLRQAVESSPFAVGDLSLPLTVSVGVALWPEDGSNLDALMEAADRALYAAKERGRNRVVHLAGP